ncbi:MAG: OmpA family protein [Planctomycetes bacterium]|nr:OmpA family protein [Planctomycetota bacterium]
MSFRNSLFVLAALGLSLLTSCTTRYQDLLRERDDQLRAQTARANSLEEELQRRQAMPVEATTAPKSEDANNEVTALQSQVGPNASVYIRNNLLSIGVNDSVTFDSGSAALKESAHRVLQNIAAVMKNQYAGHRFYIAGHTDNDPISKSKDKFRSNRHLSTERADAVCRYLVSQGVPESSVVVVGYGQYDPLSGSKAQNRRVEVGIGEKIRR